MSAIRTRFCGRCPLSDLNKLTLMFSTLILQYLNKLVKGEVRDFTSPEAFHTLKVQRLGNDRIKPFAQVSSNLVVPVLALVADMPIQPRKVSDSTPPVIRTFYLSADSFVEGAKFFQGVFEKLWRLFLFAVAKGQVGLHTKIYSYALTCSRTGFGSGGICNHVKPIGANTITKDLDKVNFTLVVAVLMKREPAFVEPQALLPVVPRFKREANTPCFKEIRRLELRRTVSSFTLELWKPTESVKEPFISGMDTDNHFVKRIAGYPRPVLLRASKQLCQVRLQAKTSRIFPVSTVISLFQLQKVVMDIRKVVKHIPQTHILWVFAQLELVCSAILFLFSLPHGLSRITPLSPNEWEAGTQSCDYARYACQRDTYIEPQFTKNVKCFFKKTLWPYTRGPTFLPNLKVGSPVRILDDYKFYYSKLNLGIVLLWTYRPVGLKSRNPV